MKRFLVLFVAVLMISPYLAAQAQPPVHPAPPAADQQELQALENDVAHLRSLVRQMQMNMALVQTTQTPLKHQFDLETEAWQVLLDGMERRLQRLRRMTGGVVQPDTVPLRPDSKQGRP